MITIDADMKSCTATRLRALYGLLMSLAMLVSCTIPGIGPSTPTTGATTEIIPTSGMVTLYSRYDGALTPTFDSTLADLITWSNKEAFFDFDTAKVINDREADVYYYVGCGTDCSSNIIAIDGAITVFQFGEKSPLGYQGCLNTLKGEAKPGGLDSLAGDYSCLRTNAGNIVQILVIENTIDRERSKFVFDYQLWHPSQTP